MPATLGQGTLAKILLGNTTLSVLHTFSTNRTPSSLSFVFSVSFQICEPSTGLTQSPIANSGSDLKQAERISGRDNIRYFMNIDDAQLVPVCRAEKRGIKKQTRLNIFLICL